MMITYVNLAFQYLCCTCITLLNVFVKLTNRKKLYTEKFSESKLGKTISAKIVKHPPVRGSSSSYLVPPSGDDQSEYSTDSAYVAYSEDSGRSSDRSVDSGRFSGGRERNNSSDLGSNLNVRNESFTELRESLLES